MNGHAFYVAQTSKPAVSRVSKPAGASPRKPTWKSAIQQVWKPALLALFALFSVNNSSAQLVTATLTLTNTATINNPTNGYTLTVDGTVLTWTNLSASTPALIANTNTIPSELTNLFNCLQLASIANVQQVYYVGTNTNTLAIVGLNLTCSQGGASNWCSLVLTTNSTTNSYFITGPASTYDTPSLATNRYSQLAADLDNFGTNAIGAFDILLSNYFSLAATQTVTGPKTFTAANSFTGSNTFTGGLSATNSTIANLVMTNGQNFGNPFRSPGGGTGSEQIGLSANASTNFTVAIGDSAQATAQYATAVGYLSQAIALYTSAFGREADALNPYDTAIGMESIAQGGHSTALGFGSQAQATNSTALGYTAIANNPNSTVIGSGATDTASNQVVLGSSSQYVVIPGQMTNLNMTGPITLQKLIAPAFLNSALANGPNQDVSYSTNTWVIVSGPSAAFTIYGFPAGVNGQLLTVEFDHAPTAPMTIGNDNGLETTPANRIYTGRSADFAITNNPAVVSFRYNSALTHWVQIGTN